MSSEKIFPKGENGFVSMIELGLITASDSARHFVLKARKRGENKKEMGLLLFWEFDGD